VCAAIGRPNSLAQRAYNVPYSLHIASGHRPDPCVSAIKVTTRGVRSVRIPVTRQISLMTVGVGTSYPVDFLPVHQISGTSPTSTTFGTSVDESKNYGN